MTVEIISWSIFMKECCRAQRGSNPWPYDHQLEADQTELLRLALLWSWSNFCGHAPPSAHSKRTIVSFWWKHVHKYWLLLRRLSLLRKIRKYVSSLTDQLNMTFIVLKALKHQLKLKKLLFLWLVMINQFLVLVTLSLLNAEHAG